MTITSCTGFSFTRVSFTNFISLLLLLGCVISNSYAQDQDSDSTDLINTGVSEQSGVILVFGDSISAAYGMDEKQGWVHLLSEKFKNEKAPYRLVNASVSGETTGGGLVRLPKTLDIHQPDIVVVELGGNDGLRGYPISKIHDNLLELTRMARASGARVLLVGMVLPPNYGQRYTQAFEKVFTDIAAKENVQILPFLLDGISTSRTLLQPDGIHPTAEAQPLLVDEIWPRLAPLLESYSETE